LISFSEFSKLSSDHKREYLMEIRAEHSVKEIMEQWGITRPLFYQIAHEVDLPLARKGGSKNQPKPKNNNKKEAPNHMAEGTAYGAIESDDATNNKLHFSLDTVGTISMVSNILSFIGQFPEQEVRIKMEVEVL